MNTLTPGPAASKKFEETFDVKAAAAAPVMMAAPGGGGGGGGGEEAKDLVDGAPQPVLEKVAKDVADKAKEQLEAAGATVEVK